jgi:hypothetical protein
VPPIGIEPRALLRFWPGAAPIFECFGIAHGIRTTSRTKDVARLGCSLACPASRSLSGVAPDLAPTVSRNARRRRVRSAGLSDD